MAISIFEMTPQFVAALMADLLNSGGERVLETPVVATLDDVARAEMWTAPGVGRVEIRQGERVRSYQFMLTETTVREPAPAPDAHVSYVPGEDPQIAALREMVNVNRKLLGIDGDGGGEER